MSEQKPVQKSASRWVPIAMKVYRLAVILLIAWVVRDHHYRLRIQGDTPITADEVTKFLPEAKELRPDHSEFRGLEVLNAAGEKIGYVVRTSPDADHITGYVGRTDTLVALDKDLKVLGIKIRSSEDTRKHVEDVAIDRQFMKVWNGKKWEEVGEMTPKALRMEGVAGSSMTSLAMAEGIALRFRRSGNETSEQPAFRASTGDIGLAVVVIAALVMTFSNVEKRKWVRRVFQVIVIAYVGLISGDLVAQSLLMGWAKSGLPWRMAPGIVLLGVVALVVPWATRKPVYCLHLCPHGAAQELVGRLTPKKWRVSVPDDVAKRLRYLPGVLLFMVIAIVMLGLPIDLASVEPFDAYIIGVAGIATLLIALGGLIAAFFVPQAYCKFGCPTGAVLEFVRSRGLQDKFTARDAYAGVLLVVAVVIYWKYYALQQWILGPM
ncbi:MAG TPA: 4Fe-4S binding protein [Verrucomicrobiae bacterium]